MTTRRQPVTTLLWSAILGLTAAVGSYGLACVFPFAAIAALAAVTLPWRQALGLTAAVWGVNQLVGFAMLDYAQGDHAVTWGLVIGGAAIFALGAAKGVSGRETRLVSWRSVAALVASIVAYQAVMFLGAVALNGFASSTAEIVAMVARNDAMWFVGLATLRLLLGMSLPRWFGTLRTA